MKKSLIALAVLAASGAALAQSSVTVYGRVDASVGSEKIGNVGAVTGISKLYSGNLTTSRLGFRGVEDLGGGLKAIFTIETGLNIDAPGASSLGDRAAFVGLTGGFGTVKLGRHDTSFDDIRDLMVSSNVWDSGSFATTETVVGTGATANNGVGGIGDYGDRASNQIRYESPSFGGVSFGLSHGLDETAVTTDDDVTAFNIRYKAGALDVGAAYQESAQSNALGAFASTNEYTTVAAAYNFGAFRVSGGWNQAKTSTNLKANTYTIGANAPVGAWDFSLGYSTGKAKLNGNTTEKGDAFSAGVVYNMSKRTRLYGLLTNGDIENGAGVKQRQRDIYAVGVAHVF